jgi:pyruvate carboxylase
LNTPGGHGVRVDSHVYVGYTIPPYYDSMIGKLIAIARTRDEAINTMYRALSEYVIEGVKTTIPFHLQLMQNEDFRKGNFTTKFLKHLRWFNNKKFLLSTGLFFLYLAVVLLSNFVVSLTSTLGFLRRTKIAIPTLLIPKIFLFSLSAFKIYYKKDCSKEWLRSYWIYV